MEAQIFLGTPQQPTRGRRYDLTQFWTAQEIFELWTKEYNVDMDVDEWIIADYEFPVKVWENENIDDLIKVLELEEHLIPATLFIKDQWSTREYAIEHAENVHYYQWSKDDVVVEYFDALYPEAEQNNLYHYIDWWIVEREFLESYTEFEFEWTTYWFHDQY